MSIDYTAIARAGGLGKGKPQKHRIEEAKDAWRTVDEKESAKVRVRSGGRCEVRIRGVRCHRRAWQVHHQIGGIGVRGRGESAKAKHKTHTCADCHGRITGKTLQHVKGNNYREVA